MTIINISIINNGLNTGTVGYLAKNAASIKLGNLNPLYKGDQTRGAWLLDHDGKTITYLASSTGERVDDQEDFDYEWTEAAKAVLSELADMAIELLENEDSNLPRPVFALALQEA